jgi:hypothetical protein
VARRASSARRRRPSRAPHGGQNDGQARGDRQASHALWRIVITRMSSHPPARAYVERRTTEGLPEKEIIRCLKRYAAREVYPHLRTRQRHPAPGDGLAR